MMVYSGRMQWSYAAVVHNDAGMEMACPSEDDNGMKDAQVIMLVISVKSMGTITAYRFPS